MLSGVACNLSPVCSRICSVMRYQVKTLGLLLGLVLVGFAQPSGEKAVGVLASKDGLRALSARFAMGGNPYLNLALVAGKDVSTNGLTAGLAFQQYLNGAACGSGACGRRSTSIAPYLEGGLRIRQANEKTEMQLLGHLGAGLLLPAGPVELFAQSNLYTALAPAQPKFDVAGGVRIRF